jgi:hypothetical protein
MWPKRASSPLAGVNIPLASGELWHELYTIQLEVLIRSSGTDIIAGELDILYLTEYICRHLLLFLG